MIDYRRHALEAFIAGTLMTIVSRLSHILAKPGTLRHEAYMSMYAYLVSALIVPSFIIYKVFRLHGEKRTTQQLEEIPLYIKVGGFAFLFFLLLMKNFHMERGIMKRFVEDYDPEIHESFPCFSKGHVDGNESRRSSQVDLEFAENNEEQNAEDSRKIVLFRSSHTE